MDRVVIVGGGFGGLYTALNLARLPGAPPITLIDRQERFVFTPLLYELVSQEFALWEVAPTFRSILDLFGIRFIQGEVVEFDLLQKRVQLTDGTFLPWGTLVIAVGGETPLDLVAGARAFALPFRSLAHAEQLMQKIRQWDQEQRQDLNLSIIGAGSSGIELACKLADRLKRRAQITLIDQAHSILPGGSSFLKAQAQQALTHRGITVLLGTSVERVENGHVLLTGHGSLASDLTLWTVGTVPAGALEGLDSAKDPRGRVRVNRQLQVQEGVYALGDSALTDPAFPVTAQVAIQQADCVAWNIWAKAKGLPRKEFNYLDLGQMMSLGIGDAACELLGGVMLEGPLAANFRRLVYTARMPGVTQPLTVGWSWFTEPVRQLIP